MLTDRWGMASQSKPDIRTAETKLWEDAKAHGEFLRGMYDNKETEEAEEREH